MKTFSTSTVLAACLALAAGVFPASADTILNSGGNEFLVAGWSAGLPAPGNNGSISVDGTYTNTGPNSGQGFDFATDGGPVTVSHTAGTIRIANDPANTDWNARNSGTAVYDWNQSGGAVVVMRVLRADRNINYTLSDTGFMTTNGAASTSGARIDVSDTGTFTQTGGSITNFGFQVDNASTMLLSGGTGGNLGRTIGGVLMVNVSGGKIDISGDYTAWVSTLRSASQFITVASGASVVFEPTWTGSFTRDSYTKADWITALNKTGVLVGGTQVTAGNFDSLFVVENAGAVGSNFSLVPEPSTLVLLAAGLVGLLCYAWRKQR